MTKLTSKDFELLSELISNALKKSPDDLQLSTLRTKIAQEWDSLLKRNVI